jgi:hypothetical protein
MCRLKTCTHVKATSRMPAGSGRRLLTCGIHSQVRQPEVDLANNANQIVSVVRPIDQCLVFLLCVRHPKKPDGSSRVEAAQDFIERAAGADAPSPLYFFGQQRRIKAGGGQPVRGSLGKEEPDHPAFAVAEFDGLCGFTQPTACFLVERESHHKRLSCRGGCYLFHPLLAARGLRDEPVEATQPPPVAQFTDFRHVYIGVSRQEFNDVGARLHAPRVELERDEMRERNDSQAASGTDDGVGCGQSALDDRRKSTAEVHDLDDTERSPNVDDATERILSVGLPKRDVISGSPQHFSRSGKRDQIGIHAQIEILSEPYIAVRRQGDGADDHRPHAARFEDRGDFLGSVNDVV